ncbi:hypothetical protein IGI41_000968 [Enterococcus sp. DIV0876]
MYKKQRNKIVELTLGILFMMIGIVSVNRPIAAIGGLVIWFGVISIARGIATITGFGAYGDNKSRGFRFFIGMIDIIVGLIFVTNLVKGAFWLGIFFAFWFLIECIGNLFLTARFSKRTGLAKMGIMFLDILCLIIAIMLMLNPLIVTLTLPILIGIFAIIYGVIQFVQGLHFSA